MHSLSDLCKAVNRPAVYLRGLLERFDLPIYEGKRFSQSYLEFIRILCFLRSLNISENLLRELWRLEKKLLQLLHANTTGSPTWFLDSCGQMTNRENRLLLSNYDLGVPVPSQVVQLGLNFADAPSELFVGKEMGEDVLRVLNLYVKAYGDIRCEVQKELPHIREAGNWAAKLTRTGSGKE